MNLNSNYNFLMKWKLNSVWSRCKISKNKWLCVSVYMWVKCAWTCMHLCVPEIGSCVQLVFEMSQLLLFKQLYDTQKQCKYVKLHMHKHRHCVLPILIYPCQITIQQIPLFIKKKSNQPRHISSKQRIPHLSNHKQINKNNKHSSDI